MNDKPRSVYARGAEDGLVLGPLLSLAIVLVGVTVYRPWAFFPAVAAMVAVPVVTWLRLRRGHAEDSGRSTLSALWLQGICGFFFGGLIMALVAYAGMRWVCPSFIADQFRTVIDAYSSIDTPEATQLADTLRRAVEARALPTPIEVALETLYGVVFTGSILSVILAAIVRRAHKTPPPFTH